MNININCPHCLQSFDLREAKETDAWRALVDLITSQPACLHEPLWRYAGLFKPLKQQLRVSRIVAVINDLIPIIENQSIKRGHRVLLPVPHQSLAKVLMWMVETPPHSLELPLKGNGYLFEVLARQSEKNEASVEKKANEQKLGNQRRAASERQHEDTTDDDWSSLRRFGINPPEEGDNNNSNQPPKKEQ